MCKWRCYCTVNGAFSTTDLLKKCICARLNLQVGDVFKHMKLPEFNPTDSRHAQLVELVQAAHSKSNDSIRENIISRISDLGNSIIENWNP